jgi:CubicO group peptidase (beta-lactamase class C family)
MKKVSVLLITGLFFCSSISIAQTPSFIADSLDSYILRGMQQWKVPGLSIVVVKDGNVVVRKGFGTTATGEGNPVDENTLFFIASNSKLFTGIALANLEHNGKLSLNDKITKYYPDFKLYDKTSTSLVSIKDMLTHRIGTKTFQGDFTFWNSTLSREEVMKRMRYLKPINPFRQDYGYCNSCFLTAGQIIPKVTGKSWEEYITDSLLNPLEMTNSYALSNGIETRHKNIAKPYTTSYTGMLTEVPYDRWDNLAPVASIVSNVKDLTNWLHFQLDSGRYKSRKIIAWPVLQKTRDVNIITSSRKSSLYPMHFRGYGLGLFSADYNGRQLYWHTGGAAGMLSNVCFVPEEKLGIAILSNNDNQNFFEALRYQILDAYLGMPYKNRSDQQLTRFNKELEEQVNEIKGWVSRITKDNIPLGLKSYTGVYRNPLYGTLKMAEYNGGLVVNFNSHENLAANLVYIGNDEWMIRYENIEYGIFKIKFAIKNGNVISVNIKMNDFVEGDPYLFEKVRVN